MALTGNTRELSLADLIVVKTQDPRNHRLSLSGPAGDGLLLIEAGRIVHAAYGELSPLDAAHVLVTEQNVDFEVEPDVEISGHTLDLGSQELLMEAMRRLDEGILRRPRHVSIEVGSSSTNVRREPPRPRSHEAKKSPEAEALRRAMGRVIFADADTLEEQEPHTTSRGLAVLAGLVLLVGATAFAWRSGWLSGEEHRDPVLASDLAGPRDVLPMLLSGAPPLAPDNDVTFLPTVVCRLLLDTRGRVYEASIYQPRSGRDAFEQAALEAVRGYSFRPAEREGVPVPVWINWPVDFVRAPSTDEPRPVDARWFKDKRPGDRLPTLIEGEPPASPVPGRAVSPEIPCRLLVDDQGLVADAHVVEPDSALELYERAALDAIRAYRFTPAEREGVIVPVWLDWTVEFR